MYLKIFTVNGSFVIRNLIFQGFDRAEGGGIDLISHIITRHLKIPCHVLMGANLAGEVADEKFCETTIGCRDRKLWNVLRDLIQTSYFRVVVVEDSDTVEVCGALKVHGHVKSLVHIIYVSVSHRMKLIFRALISFYQFRGQRKFHFLLNVDVHIKPIG